MNYWWSVILAAGSILVISLGLILLAARRRRRPQSAPDSFTPPAPDPFTPPAPATDAGGVLAAERIAWQREAAVLRQELTGLRQEVAGLRQDAAGLRQELERVKTQQTSPAARPGYADAITLAREGASAQLLAGRCGISHSEAELIVALHGRPMAH